MKELIIHADKVSYEVTKKTGVAEEIPKEMEKGEMEEVLWLRIAVEKDDEGKIENLVRKAVEDVKKVAEQVKVKNVMIYPYAHLLFGSKPSDPKTALNLLKGIEEELKKEGFEVMRAPFGWYKKFTVVAKGHPLSELSRVFHGEESEERDEVSASVKAEEELKSRFYILTPEGELVEAEKYDYKGREGLRKLMSYETKKMRAYEKEPPHIKIMQEQELVDYEPGSDAGNFRFYPKGRLIKKLLEESITDFCIDLGAMEVETPLMYDFEHPSLKKYLNRFPARQYVVLSEDKRFFLRFAACFGQFLMNHDMVMSYRHLPLKMYELARYSFRREQTGELAGLKRLRAFTMPDMHTLARDMEMAKKEFEKQLEAGIEWLGGTGLYEGIETAFRVQSDFYEENKEWYREMVKKLGKPVLVELFDERYAYFITKFEFNFIDTMDKASALTTVQIDVENAETYDINFVEENGEKKRPLILHASISGGIERVIYALLENEAGKMKKGKKAMLPVWLSPTQIRVIPISRNQLEYAKKVAEGLKEFRVDVDDRDESLGKRIRAAEKEWIPYVIVVGEKEEKEKKIAVTIRETQNKKEMNVEEIEKEIAEKTRDFPKTKLSLPQLISKRPTFRG
ncbi:threonine--tRNA ligase [Candidatus Micrarchaeota archaeon]|nr:threonine--tRNA ligase [Candidatus Micrarchaeota archaeon]